MGSDIIEYSTPKSKMHIVSKCAYMTQDNHILVHKTNFHNIKELKS